MSINQRVKELRKVHLNMTQEIFAKSINITRSSIALIETEKTALTERNISEICRTFKVNPDWLRYGEGEVFKELSYEEELAEYFGNVLATSDISKDFQKRLIYALSKLDDSDWKVLEKIAENLLEKNKKNPE